MTFLFAAVLMPLFFEGVQLAVASTRIISSAML
jgi:hypothetical protein